MSHLLPVQAIDTASRPAYARVPSLLTVEWFAGVVPDDLPPPPFDDTFWGGPASDTLVLRGELAEWSCDAVGWLGEVLADCAAAAGVRAPMLVTVARDR